MAEAVDVLIAGGSLAGAATALRLHQLGVTPVVVEKSPFPRGKLCGCFLGPDAVAPLQQLGVWDAVQADSYGPVETMRLFGQQGQAWTLPLRWVSGPHPWGVGVDRPVIDSRLLSAVREAGIPVWQPMAVRSPLRRNGEGWRGVLSLPEWPARPFACRVFVDATGRHGGLRAVDTPPMQTFDPRRSGPKLVGIQGVVAGPSPWAELVMCLFSGGYGGIQPLPGGVSNVCALFQWPGGAAPPPAEWWAQTLGRHPVVADWLAQARWVGRGHTTAGLNLPQAGGGALPWIAVGDAGVTVDPMTGSGMALALETGCLAAEVIAAGLHARRDPDWMRAEYQRRYDARYGLRLRLLRRFRPVLFSAGWQRTLAPVAPVLLPGLARVFR